MKNYLFKNKRYELYQLIILNSDENIAEYSSGEVINTITQDKHQIQDLFNIYTQDIKELLSSNSLDFKSQKTLTKIYTNNIKDIKITNLISKLYNDNITLEEIEEWILFMSRKEKEEFGKLKYKNFQILNSDIKLPENLKRSDYGTFCILIKYMNYKNQIAYENGKPIKRLALSNLIGISPANLNNFISRMKQLKMLKVAKIKDKKFIVINPAYTTKFTQINPELVYLFESDIQEFLNKLEIKYMNILKNDINYIQDM